VGDILLFSIGDAFTVDGIIIEGSSVKIDESSLTGESDE
jgi:Ca2+ transporting ATPase